MPSMTFALTSVADPDAIYCIMGLEDTERARGSPTLKKTLAD